jgi:RNA polymerase sigma factor (TIGR02999 family)
MMDGQDTTAVGGGGANGARSRMTDVSDLLRRWSAGDARALEDLTPLVYDDLRRLARAVLSREGPGHTLSATALVHEVYLRLIDQRRVRLDDRGHFFSAAAHIMRRVLVDHARARAAAKRGGGQTRVDGLGDADIAVDGFAEEIVDLDAALTKLGQLDSRKVRIVEMKCLAGMTVEEIATSLGISDATVERDWKFARAWLLNAMRAGAPAPDTDHAR